MSTLLSPKTIPNDWTRAWSAFILVVAQCILLSGGMCDPAASDTDGAFEVPPAGQPAPPSAEQNAGQTNDQSGDQTQNDSVAYLSGAWVVQRAAAAGATDWGRATAYVASAVLNTITFTIKMEDGSAPLLLLRRGAEGGFVGYWQTSIADFPNPSDQVNWTGSESADHNTLTGTWVSGTGTTTTTLRRALMPDHTCTGVWTRSGIAATAIVATNGTSLLMSVLDASGDWPTEQRYDVRTIAGERLSGSGFEAFIFDAGNRLYLRSTRGSAPGMLFEKASAQSDLNGRWIGGDRRWSGATVQRSVRVIVAHNETLYVHDAWDANSDSLVRSFRAPLRAGQYTDSVAEWSGRLTPDRMRLAGAWTGRPEWYNSADRTAAPIGNDLTGEWSSISLDWNHHDASGDILRMYGAATLTRTGDRLKITDRYDDGTTYQLDATWVGDHYEGLWWNTAAPDETSPWRGEMIANGSYLHGTWNNGEYSFSAYPFGQPSSIPTQAADTRIVAVDPYEDIAATVRETATNTAATMYRSQTGLSEVSVVNADGEYRVTFDDRLRPARASAPGRTYTFAWSADSTAIDVTIEHGGTVNRSRIAVDFRDAGLLGALDYLERETRRDVAPFRQWVAAHPGRVLAIVRGEQAPPVPLPRSMPPPVSVAGAATQVSLASSARGVRIAANPLDEGPLTEAATIAGLIWAVVASYGAALAAVTVFANVFFAGLFLLALIAATVLTIYYIQKHLVCHPCGLACFWNCTPLPKE